MGQTIFFFFLKKKQAIWASESQGKVKKSIFKHFVLPKNTLETQINLFIPSYNPKKILKQQIN
jgi:hypothetical protein